MKGYGNLSLQSAKRPKRSKFPSFVVSSHFKDRALTAVKRDEKF